MDTLSKKNDIHYDTDSSQTVVSISTYTKSVDGPSVITQRPKTVVGNIK